MAEKTPSMAMPVTAAGSTQDAGRPGQDDKSRVFPCESCGADLRFHIGAQSLKCPYCGFVKALDLQPEVAVEEQDFRAMLQRIAQLRVQERGEEEDFREVRCSSCAATVRFSGTLASRECPYCGVALQVEGIYKAPDRVPVDGTLPFLIDRDTAQANLAAWVRSRWFAPNDFKARGVQGRFDGVYLPYWTFDSLTMNRYSGQRGEYYWVTVGSGKKKRRVRRVRWYPASGTFQRFFDDVLVVASSGLPEGRILALEPWPLNRCTPFSAELLAGFLARTYDVPLDEGFVNAKDRMDQAIEADVKCRIGGDVQRIHSINTRYDAVTYKHLLLPVWMLAYRYGEKPYQVVVNAGTGEVQGDRPYSWIKIALAVVGVVAVAGSVAFVISHAT